MDMLAEAVFRMPCIVPFTACQNADQDTKVNMVKEDGMMV
jgi:hypothetical protein